LLDGVPMTATEWDARRSLLPLAVMVDNSPGGFPQTGLDRADVVYEAFVEGGITRFMAVYWRREADLVVPVRSARTPFLVWAAELGALYGHGGSAATFNEANAQGQIYEWNIKDLDAFVPGSSPAYRRVEDRYAPYNLATSTRQLRDVAAALRIEGGPLPAAWRFKADFEETASASVAEGIELQFRGSRDATSVVQWRWDQGTNSYFRWQLGGPHFDGATGRQLSFKTVVVMRIPSEVVDEAGHVVLNQSGSGQGTIFLDGRAMEVTWKKPGRTARTRFYDAGGQEVALNRGPVFIEAINPGSRVVTVAQATGLPPMPAYEARPAGPTRE
jgi:hypothetical protein